ncbi:MAG: DNA polymerase III subunit beta [Acidobacteria bacterium]|nr:DNA polymerase III subunit beta [Acidobacteriota bacterium]
MHLRVSKAAFLKELNLIQGVVEKKSTIPILSNLLLETKDGALCIKGTDLDVSISTWCEAEVLKDGSNCIQAKKLFEIVRALPEAEIEIKRVENDQVNIICERSRFKMPGLAIDNFPEIKEFTGPFIGIPAELLKTFISRTIFAITNEESRYALNGAKFELTEKTIRMVATDGHRLSFIEKQSDLGRSNLDVLIPKKTLAELGRLSAETDEAIEFGYDENHLFFRVGRRLLTSRTLSGQFPNYQLVLPKENDNSVVIESDRISSAIKRVALMADERSHSIKFELGDGQINITSQAAEVGEAGEVLPVEYTGPSITAGFNAQYLLDFFSVIQSDEVAFEFKDGNSQAQIKERNEAEYDFRYIVMPMRV